jgi:dolichol-phosphate mannosyltransferase
VAELVVIPTYNEVLTIARVLAGVRKALPHAHILVVDDQSPDGTGGVARREGDRLGKVSVLTRSCRRGVGSAYREGLSWGLDRGMEILYGLDADLSHDPRDLPRLRSAVLGGADAAVGSRRLDGSQVVGWPAHRVLLSRVGNGYARLVLRLATRDATAGLRAYGAATLRAVELARVRADGHGFQIEMIHRVERLGGHVVEVPICFTQRPEGRSKLSMRILVEALVVVSSTAFRDRRLLRDRRPFAAPRRA